MLAVDVFTCYATAGAGALVGLGLMTLIRTDQHRLQSAVSLFRWAFRCLACLLLISLVPAAWRGAVTMFSIGCAAAGVALLAWAFRELNGRQTHPQVALVITVASAVLLWAAAASGSDTLFVQSMAGVFALLGMGAAIDQGWLLLRSPRTHGTEISLMLVATVFALIWVITLGHTFGAGGPYPAHWLFAPDWLLPVTAQGFAIMPLSVASLVLAVINHRLQQQLRSRAMSDDLTGALSRRGFRELGARMLAAPRQPTHIVAVLMIDIDQFKAVNDRYGHQAGDDVLKHLTQLTRERLREDALLARYSGEEFTVMVPVRSHLEASAVAERLRQTVADTSFATVAGPVQITVSIGVAFHLPEGTIEEALAKADVCLHEAKKAGRNRVVTAQFGG